MLNNVEMETRRTQRSKTTSSPPKVDYKGITLKEYFLLCDTFDKIDEEYEESFASKEAETPTFL